MVVSFSFRPNGGQSHRKIGLCASKMPGSSTFTRCDSALLVVLLMTLWLWSTRTSPSRFLGSLRAVKGNIGLQETDRVTAAHAENGSSNASDCRDYRFMPPGTFPTIALASVQGSGNTWVRWLLQSSTGFAAASIYNEPHTKGFRREKCVPCNGQALVIKTHVGIQEPMDGAIIIIRNPYSALIAEFNRRRSGSNHVGLAPLELFFSSAWPTYVQNLQDRFLSLSKRFINKGKPVHVVFYENLKKNVEKELRRMLQFLKVDINEKRLACTLSNAEGTSHRAFNATRTFDPFSKKQRQVIDGIISKLDALLKENDLPALPENIGPTRDPFRYDGLQDLQTMMAYLYYLEEKWTYPERPRNC